MQVSAAMPSETSAICRAVNDEWSSSARAAASAYGPPDPTAAAPKSGSMTSPAPLRTKVRSTSATTSSASRRRRKRSVRQSFPSSTQARARLALYSWSFDSKRSKRVKASAVLPAKPASTRPSPSRRTLRALAFITVLSSVTCPSPPSTTRPSRRTQRMVVPWNIVRLPGHVTAGWRRFHPGVRRSVGSPRSSAACLSPGLRLLVTGDVDAGRRASGVRMCPVVHRLELLDAHLGVLLGRGEARVAEQLLDDAHVRAASEKVRRERVAERVRAHLSLQRELEHGAVQVPGDASGREPSAAVVQEQRGGVLPRSGLREELAAALEPAPERGDAARVHRAEALLAALAHHPDGAGAQVEVIHVQPARFADPQPRAVEQLEQRAVAEPEHAVLARDGEHREHLVHRKNARKPGGELGAADG